MSKIELMGKKYKHKYKAMLCDIDGTLVTNKYNGRISKRVYDSIINAKKNVKIGIASGRALDRVTFLFKELGLKGPCIINGGAQIVNPVSRKILWERQILQKDLKNITSIVNQLTSKVWIVDNNREQIYTQNLNLRKPISFFIPRIQEKRADMIIRNLSHYHSLALTKVVAYHQGCVALHITHSQATKKYAALKYAELIKVTKADIIGVGDGYNDFPLFKACGLRVAVGNAVPGLKKIADYIAPSVNDDGVAHVIEKFVFSSINSKV